MRERLNIPRAVIEDISKKLKESVDETISEMESAAEDEDTLTGHLGARLTTRARHVSISDDEVNGVWTWSLKYTKFRGRGPKATESYIGADGIFELTLDGSGRNETKSILFQSKMKGSGGTDLIEQCAKLSTWREAAFVIQFSPEAILAATIDQTLAARGIVDKEKSVPLDKFLADNFIVCLIGDNDLRYIPTKRILVWDSFTKGRVSADFSIKHRFSIKVRRPSINPHDVWVGERIPTSDIRLHRMRATPEDILSSTLGVRLENPKKEQRALSRIYHPDLWRNTSPETQEAMKVRTQEINDAFNQLKKR